MAKSKSTQSGPVVLKAEVQRELRNDIKVRAAQEGRTITAVVVRAVQQYLSKPVEIA